MSSAPLIYDFGGGVEAFSSRRESVLPFSVIRGHQVHKDEVAVVEDRAMALGKSPNSLTREDLWGYDALVTAVPNLGIAVRTADCIPVLLYDPCRQVVAAVHAGWKGTVAHISQRVLEVMSARFEVQTSSVRAVIGPGISLSSFQVGGEVVEAFKNAGFPTDKIVQWQGEPTGEPMQGGFHIDLFEANRWLLVQAGVQPEYIHVCGIDTYRDTSFFSARREGTACGRIISGIRVLPDSLFP